MVSRHLSSLPKPGAYVSAWRALKALPDDARVKEPGWAGSVVSAAEMRRQMRVALDKRINVRGGDLAANDPIDIGWVRDARRLKDIKLRRVRVYQFERPEMRAKFGHLLASYND